MAVETPPTTPRAMLSDLPPLHTSTISSPSPATSSQPRTKASPRPCPSITSTTITRDFAYPSHDPKHHGAPHIPDTATRASKAQRKTRGRWRGEPDQGVESPTELQLSQDGPPWKEDDDLLSPTVRMAKHKKSKSRLSEDTRGRARPTEDAQFEAQVAGMSLEDRNYTTENSSTYFPTTTEDQDDVDSDEPDSQSPTPFDEEDESRYSREYQFHIASPDEEMHGKAVALFDFARENENELPLLEGQVLWVSYRHGQGWLVAQDPKTGENGLVPEEYVRLLRDIEGGLHGLNGQIPGLSPASEGPELGQGSPEMEVPTGPVPSSASHERNMSGVSAASEHYTPILSHFTTSSKDLQPYDGPPIEKGVSPRIPQMSPTRSPIRTFRPQVERQGSQAADLVALAREQMAEQESRKNMGLGLSPDDETEELDNEEQDDDEPVILEDAVAREIRRSHGPPT